MSPERDSKPKKKKKKKKKTSYAIYCPLVVGNTSVQMGKNKQTKKQKLEVLNL